MTGRSSQGMTIFDDLAAEQDRLEEVLSGLDASQWASPSQAAGWSVADVVLHLAQAEEGVVASVTGIGRDMRPDRGRSVEEAMDDHVSAERTAPEEVFRRWREARHAAVAALRAADPDVPLTWVETPLKPATLATTRLAEHWAHGLDVTVPLGLAYPDTDRLRHVAWLAHRTLPYALTAAGETPHPVYCELTAPDGTTVALAAAGSGNLDAVKYALELDPKLDYIGPNHRSIMHFAIANKNPDTAIPMLQYLADKGAKLDVPDAKGDTPGDFINRGGQQDIRIFYIQLLKDHGIVSKHDH